MKISELMDTLLPSRGWKVFAVIVCGIVVGGGEAKANGRIAKL